MSDLISRKAVLDYIDSMPSELTADGRRMIRRIRLTEYIQDSLPSAQPGIYATELWAKSEKEFLKWLNEDVSETNVGKWIEDEFTDNIRCSHCGSKWNWFDNDTDRFKFCPNCGARMMRGESNEKNEMGDQKAGP